MITWRSDFCPFRQWTLDDVGDGIRQRAAFWAAALCVSFRLYIVVQFAVRLLMKKQIKASRRSLGMNYAIREVTVPAAEAAASGMKMLNLNIGDPNKWDFETPEYFKQTLREAVDVVDNGYGDSQGQPDLREAIVRRELQKNGVAISSKDVYVTAGVSECINVMMGTFIEPGDEVLVPGPGYPSYAQYINFYEGRTVPYRQIEEED